MNILFLTLGRVSNVHSRGIYTDLMREFVRDGHSLYLVKPNERACKEPTRVTESCGVKILGVKTLNIQKTNILEKGIGTLLLEYQYCRAIEKYFKQVKFDMILYSTPPITFNKVISSVKTRCNAKSYLLLKDIFPQNAVDLGMFSSKSIFYKLFRKKERELYRLSDYIGCMSPANVEYLLRHNPELAREKVEVCPNSIELSREAGVVDRNEVLTGLGIPPEQIVFVYGGNLGKPQGVDFLMEVLVANEKRANTCMVIAGSGTEFFKLKKWFVEYKPRNAKLLTSLPGEEYDRLVQACDVGLVFLDKRFTIPNYPSRLLSYLENKMAVLMAIDMNTDIGVIAEQNGYGKWVESGNLEGFNHLMDQMASDKSELIEMGKRGYKYLQDNYTVDRGYKIIMSHFDKDV